MFDDRDLVRHAESGAGQERLVMAYLTAVKQ
jgi:hypothetical protein